MTTDIRKQAQKESQKALAVLIKNTRTGHRHLSLPEIADWLDIAIKELGSISNVSDRIGISTNMLRQFQYVKKLSPRVQQLFRERKVDSVDIAVHLSMLNDADQIPVSQQIASGQLDSADVRAILDLRKSKAYMKIQAIIDRVKESKNIKEYVAEFIVRNKAIDTGLLRKRFDHVIGEKNIVSLRLKGSFGSIVMTLEGKGRLEHRSREKRVSRSGIINAIVQGDLA